MQYVQDSKAPTGYLEGYSPSEAVNPVKRIQAWHSCFWIVKSMGFPPGSCRFRSRGTRTYSISFQDQCPDWNLLWWESPSPLHITEHRYPLRPPLTTMQLPCSKHGTSRGRCEWWQEDSFRNTTYRQDDWRWERKYGQNKTVCRSMDSLIMLAWGISKEANKGWV